MEQTAAAGSDLQKTGRKGIIEAPFPADEEKPYAFVSYSHKDRDRVFPVIKDLYERGYRLWYDEGLEIGEEYYATLKKHVKECAVFLLMASAQSAKSEYINQHEIPQAKEFRRPFVVCRLGPDVHFEGLDLKAYPGGTPDELPRILSGVKGYACGEKRTARGHQVRISLLSAGRDQEYDFEVCPGGVRLTKYRGSSEAVEIPAEYPPDTGIRVVELGRMLFWLKKPPIREVAIPPTVHTVHVSCFSTNGELSRLVVPGSVKYIRSFSNVKQADDVRMKLDEQEQAEGYVPDIFLPHHEYQKGMLTVCTPPGSPTEKIIQTLSKFEYSPLRIGGYSDYSKIRVEPYLDEKPAPEPEKTAYITYSGREPFAVLSILNELQNQQCRFFSEPVRTDSARSELFLQASAVLAFVEEDFLRSGGTELLEQSLESNLPICVYKLSECEMPPGLARLDTVHQLLYNYGSERERITKLVNWLTENGCHNEYDIPDFIYRTKGKKIRLVNCFDTIRTATVPERIAGRKVRKFPLRLFRYQHDLEYITIEPGAPGYASRDGFLTNKAGTVLVLCPRGRSGIVRIPDGIQKIRKRAFGDCMKIESVECPESLRSIGKNGFEHCVRLKAVSLPEGLRKISSFAFSECRLLREIRFPSGLRKLGSCAFYKCENLQPVILPDTFRKIHRGLFARSDFSSVTIPGTVSEIGTAAFRGSTDLTEAIIREGTLRIGRKAFKNCKSLREIEIPDSVNTIAKNAFAKCPHLVIRCHRDSCAWYYAEDRGFRFAETNGFVPPEPAIDLPFYYQVKGDKIQLTECLDTLRQAIVPAEVKGHKVGKVFPQVFRKCESLEYITVDPGVPGCASREGFLTNKSGTSLLLCPRGRQGAVRIPEGIRKIGRAAFMQCSGMESVIVPNSVRSLGPYCFYMCENLRNVILPPGIKHISKGAFDKCPNAAIRCEKGSYAWKYAEKNRIPVKERYV